MDLERKSPFDLAIVLQLCLPFVTKLENNWVPLENNQEYLSVWNHEDHYEPFLGSVPEKGTLSGRDWNLEKPRLELLVGMIWFYHTEFSHGDHSKKKKKSKNGWREESGFIKWVLFCLGLSFDKFTIRWWNHLFEVCFLYW